MAFGIDLPSYHGPLDLLLYLVRREELPLEELSLARITHQYMSYLEILESLDLDDVGEFVDITSQLIEYKAKAVLPAVEDPSDDESSGVMRESMPQLVDRLIQYKRFRDAASLLDEQSRRWQLRYSRLASDLPPRRIDADEVPIARVEVWDLVSAFGRILKARQKTAQHSIQYDDTPIHVYMSRIHAQVLQLNRVELQELFEVGMHKSALIAMFLATLEMTRHHGLYASQETADGPLFLLPGPDFPAELDVAKVENLALEAVANSNLPVVPR
ncbi:MAG: segregation and condensation protein A [Pirellula sp.]|jgi:segregation and condensation protein A